jgi:hypothetical protein
MFEMPSRIPIDRYKLRSLLSEWSRYDPDGEKFPQVHHLSGSQRGFEQFCSEHNSFHADGNNIRFLRRLRFVLGELKNAKTFEHARETAFERHPVKTEALRRK